MLHLSKTSGSWTLAHMEDFFREHRLWVSKLIVVARSAGGALLGLDCKPVDPGVGDGGSLTM